MDKFEQLFAEYPFTLTDELVKKNTADILAQHTAENNTREVWMQLCASAGQFTRNYQHRVG
mgnify:CR=1 FL=1